MIENFLRRPQTAGEVTADLIRIAGFLSILIAALWFDLTDAGVLAFTLPGLLVPRFVGVRSWFDIVFGMTLLAAAWSNVFDLYTRVPGWDLVVHFACTGVLAMVVYLLLARRDVVHPPGAPAFRAWAAIVMTAVFGLAMSAVWEMIEWFGHAFISDAIFVAYDDTIGDMAVGGLGAVLGGFAIAFLTLYRREDAPAAARRAHLSRSVRDDIRR